MDCFLTADLCARFNSTGDNGQLKRASAQALGLMVNVEGPRFARRVPELLPAMVGLLESQAAHTSSSDVQGDEEDPEGQASPCPGWQEAYNVLVLTEKLVSKVAAQLAWAQGGRVHQLWTTILLLLLHRHLWVRKVAARLVGVALADGAIGGGLFAQESRVGELALSLYLQLESEAADETAALQAVKCLVALSGRLHRQWQEQPTQEAAGILPASSTAAGKRNANGSAPSTPGGRFNGSLPSDAMAGSASDEDDERAKGADASTSEDGSNHENGVQGNVDEVRLVCKLLVCLIAPISMVAQT